MCFEHKYKLYINSQARFEYVLPSEYGDLSGLYFSAFSLNAEIKWQVVYTVKTHSLHMTVLDLNINTKNSQKRF